MKPSQISGVSSSMPGASFRVGPHATHADAGIIDDRFNCAKTRARRGNGALAARGIGKIGEDGMKAVLGRRMPGREPVERLWHRDRPQRRDGPQPRAHPSSCKDRCRPLLR